MLDRILTWFIYVWCACVAIMAAADIITIIIGAPTTWSGILAAQEKWFDPFNVMHFVSEIIVLSPAIGAYLWREKLRNRTLQGRDG